MPSPAAATTSTAVAIRRLILTRCSSCGLGRGGGPDSLFYVPLRRQDSRLDSGESSSFAPGVESVAHAVSEQVEAERGNDEEDPREDHQPGRPLVDPAACRVRQCLSPGRRVYGP